MLDLRYPPLPTIKSKSKLVVKSKDSYKSDQESSKESYKAVKSKKPYKSGQESSKESHKVVKPKKPYKSN